jgi:hypothetical protein
MCPTQEESPCRFLGFLQKNPWLASLHLHDLGWGREEHCLSVKPKLDSILCVEIPVHAEDEQFKQSQDEQKNQNHDPHRGLIFIVKRSEHFDFFFPSYLFLGLIIGQKKGKKRQRKVKKSKTTKKKMKITEYLPYLGMLLMGLIYRCWGLWPIITVVLIAKRKTFLAGTAWSLGQFGFKFASAFVYEILKGVMPILPLYTSDADPEISRLDTSK